MSVYHKNASNEKAYTYLKRARDDDVKLTTHELVTSYFNNEDSAPKTASSARYAGENRSLAKTSHGIRQTKRMGVDQKHQQSFKSVMWYFKLMKYLLKWQNGKKSATQWWLTFLLSWRTTVVEPTWTSAISARTLIFTDPRVSCSICQTIRWRQGRWRKTFGVTFVSALRYPANLLIQAF